MGKVRVKKLLPKDLMNLGIMGENIKLARLRRNLTSIVVSERADIARSTLNLIEKGDPSVSLSNYFKVLKVLNLSHDIINIASNDELGRKLQDLELLNKEEKEASFKGKARIIFNNIRLGLLKGSYSNELQNIVGLSSGELKKYLESNSYGFKLFHDFIDIDHIKPIDSINSSEDIYLINHFSNLQLLPSNYNRQIKKNKVWSEDHFKEWFKYI